MAIVSSLCPGRQTALDEVVYGTSRRWCGAPVLTALLLGACGPFPAPLPDPPPAALERLQFASPALQQQLTALDHCVREQAGAGWRHLPYAAVGNFYRARWCRGPGAGPDCRFAGSNESERDQNQVELGTLHHTFPEVFGLTVNARWVPPATGWGASFWFARGGESILGEGFGLIFQRFDAPSGESALQVDLGDTVAYRVALTTVRLGSNEPLEDQLAGYLADPEALRDRGLERSRELAAAVEAVIAEHRAEICDYGPYQGGGIPPECHRRPLRPAEEASALAAARAHFAAQQAALRDDYHQMWEALLEAFPFDRCWTEAGGS